MKRHKSKLFFITTLFLLGIVFPVFALEVSWPEIGGITPSESSTFTEFTLYFFSLLVVAGSGFMFIAMMTSGFMLLTGNGNPGTFQAAKQKLLGSAIGMVILLGSYEIIGEVNKNILQINEPTLTCNSGFERKIKRTKTDEKGKEKEYIFTNCVSGDNPDIEISEDEELLSETPIFTKCETREIIVYSEKDYKGIKTVLFKDDTLTDTNCPDAGSISLGEARSIRIIPKIDGLYLYDNGLFKGGESLDNAADTTNLLSPYFVKSTVDNFNEMKINDKIDKIEFVSKSMDLTGTPMDKGNISYGYSNGAVLFTEPKLRGSCVGITSQYNDIKQKDLALDKDLDIRDDISSLIYYYIPFTRDIDQGMGHVVLYATSNCEDFDETKDMPETVEKGMYDKCSVAISPGSTGFGKLEKTIESYCQGYFLTDDSKEMKKKGKTDGFTYFPVQSMKIEGSAGVVLKSDSGYCHYFDLKESERRGNCIINLNDAFSSWKGGEKPKTIMVIPLVQKK
ncbi:MAG: hypothetical protein PHW52_05485 [Candidatus Pacebacteria bacterium]|nr:hypothetical protein [Candidatus Paceibacterota bacterium]